ncbi:metallophosphoesterase family protein [Pseudomonas sp. CrR25]|nr:metallophosphoesterase family protein [Pseudomonas sp. CrR25]
MRIGLIADTHGLLREEALTHLQGCDHLIHAGDIGDPRIVASLQSIAPLSVVRGNNDRDDWAQNLPERLVVRFGRTAIYVLHDLKDLDIDPPSAGIDVVVAGHSHKPTQEQRDGVLYINPGSAGPRRFKLPVAVALLHIAPTGVRSELVELGD